MIRGIEFQPLVFTVDKPFLLKKITNNSEQLYDAIKNRTRTSSKSESNKYLDKVMTVAGNAKFSKTTIGAVLEYKPTLQKFKDFSIGIDKLINDVEVFIASEEHKKEEAERERLYQEKALEEEKRRK